MSLENDPVLNALKSQLEVARRWLSRTVQPTPAPSEDTAEGNMRHRVVMVPVSHEEMQRRQMLNDNILAEIDVRKRQLTDGGNCP